VDRELRVCPSSAEPKDYAASTAIKFVVIPPGMKEEFEPLDGHVLGAMACN
jgi:hypothetical protein